ncbi:hypothetical protein C8F01DRAFT_1099396 [Mycena amicta]|nr:hypothetical protein C8F01DRAFT_1099396 [Mycena amicta]
MSVMTFDCYLLSVITTIGPTDLPHQPEILRGSSRCSSSHRRGDGLVWPLPAAYNVISRCHDPPDSAKPVAHTTQMSSIAHAALRLVQRQFYHEFFLLDVPEEKYGQHIALVYHKPKGTFRKVVAVFGRMEKEISAAKCIGSVSLWYPFDNTWEELEKDANWCKSNASTGTDAAEIFRLLQRRRSESLREGSSVVDVDVAVYLVKVKTTRKDVLYDGDKTSLPRGYLTYVDSVCWSFDIPLTCFEVLRGKAVHCSRRRSSN